MAWAFVNDPPGPAKSLGAVAAAGSGQASTIARELLAMGEPGRSAAELFEHLLAHAGYAEAAAEVGRLRTASSWPPASTPPERSDPWT